MDNNKKKRSFWSFKERRLMREYWRVGNGWSGRCRFSPTPRRPLHRRLKWNCWIFEIVEIEANLHTMLGWKWKFLRNHSPSSPSSSSSGSPSPSSSPESWQSSFGVGKNLLPRSISSFHQSYSDNFTQTTQYTCFTARYEGSRLLWIFICRSVFSAWIV